MDRKEMLRMDTVYIPSNYTDAGKLLGAFALRQVAECCGHLSAAGGDGVPAVPRG